MVFLQILGVICSYLIVSLPIGYFSYSLHKLKGYYGKQGFWYGFLFGIVGLIYSVGLPDNKNSVIRVDEKGETLIIKEENIEDSIEFVDEEIEENVEVCSECGWQIFPENYGVCSNCGTCLKPQTCPECGWQVMPEEKSCLQCGYNFKIKNKK